MPRQVFEASIFHLSPYAVEWLLRVDTFKMDYSCAPFEGGFLIQCQTSSVWKKPHHDIPDVKLVFDQASSETTHLFFRKDGLVLSLPTHDQQTVLSTYDDPPFARFCDDSFFARSGYEALCDQEEITEGTPDNFTSMILDCAARLRRQIPFSRFQIEDDIEFAYNLACGVEYVKLETNQDWTHCDSAMQQLARAVDANIQSLDQLFSAENRYLDGLILAAKSRICRSLRVKDEWRSRPVL